MSSENENYPRSLLYFLQQICTALAKVAIKCREWPNAFAHVVRELGLIGTSSTNYDDFGPEKSIVYFISDFSIQIYKSFGELVGTGAFPFDKVVESFVFQNIMLSISSYESVDIAIISICVQAFNDCISLLIYNDCTERAGYYEKFQTFSSKLFPIVLKATENSDYEYLKCLIEIHLALLDGFEEDVINDAQTLFLEFVILMMQEYILLIFILKLLFETFNFWIDFTTHVINSVFNQTFLYPFFQKYGNISIHQIYKKMPVEMEYINETLYVLDNNDITDFRIQSLDTLISLFSIIDPANYYNLVMSHIKTGQLNILQMEAALYFLLGVVPPCKNLNFDDLIQIILSFSADSPKLLLETSCKILSELISLAKDSDVVDSLTKLCAVFISASDSDIIPIQLDTVCSMQLDFANNLLKTSGYSKSLEVCAPIDMIGSIFKFLIVPKETDRSLLRSLINKIIIFAVEILDISRYSDDLCEKICRLLRYMIKFMGPSYCLKREISKKAIEWFIISGRSSFIYLMCTIVDLYSKDIVNQEWILHDFLLFGQPAILSLNQDIATPEFPYLLEDYIRLCIKIYHIMPVSFLSSEICKPAILTTIKGLLCENKKSFNACYSFLSMIFKEKFYERDIDRLVVKDSVAIIFVEFAHLIIKYCLQNIFSHKSLVIIEFSGELLVVLLKYNQVIFLPSIFIFRNPRGILF
ncbi:hypothetical protein MXB_813, partial [Myxobolus squamalis]